MGIRAAELFAGVGGFRLGLESAGVSVVWSNQWEPSTKRQHASDCYIAHFGSDGHVNDDIAKVLDRVASGEVRIPEFDMLVGGFPCQDYSVAKTLNQAAGIEGKKGVLWWEIFRLLKWQMPKHLLLENVDRLLKSPAGQRGRDFAIILACLNDLGYQVEWRVVNAAEYGAPQRRRRVFIYARRSSRATPRDPIGWLLRDGILARALPVVDEPSAPDFSLDGIPGLSISGDLVDISKGFGSAQRGPFLNSGLAVGRRVWTRTLRANYEGEKGVLADVLIAENEVPKEYFIPDAHLEAWRYLKGAKRIKRQAKNGHLYEYAEGAIPFPDPVAEPSRTILTGEGGQTPSRFKHVVAASRGRFRRLTPVELERLNGFPAGWTDTGMPDGRRAFMMGNALVIDVVRRITAEIINESRRPARTARGA